MKDKRFLYISELTKNEQQQIKEDVTEVLKSLDYCNFEEDLERAMGGKLIDLEDTININKYLSV